MKNKILLIAAALLGTWHLILGTCSAQLVIRSAVPVTRSAPANLVVTRFVVSEEQIKLHLNPRRSTNEVMIIRGLANGRHAATITLSAAGDEQFQFPLKSLSAPALAWTPPTASYTVPSTPNPAYPIVIPVSGTWTDPSGCLNRIQVQLQLSTETTPRSVLNMTFPACASKAFAISATLEAEGTYSLILTGTDALGLSTTHTLTVTATGTGTAVCAAPILTLANGTPVPTFELDNTSTLGTRYSDGVGWADDINQYGSPYYPNSGDSLSWDDSFAAPVVPFGILIVNCTTPGATITFAASAYIGPGGEGYARTTSNTNPARDYPNYQPAVMPGAGDNLVYIYCQAHVSGVNSKITGAILAAGLPGL